MPFIEVHDFEPARQVRENATKTMTDGLCEAFGIKPEIVTVYYFSTSDYCYGHAGKYGNAAEKLRIFVKVHAFPRDASLKGRAAENMTRAIVDAYGADPKDVIVYFIDRDPADAFHAGKPSA